MQTAFLYCWTQASTGMWYVGSRTAKNCHPNDGYICSSKNVKPLIEATPDDWKRDILLIAPPLYIREIEAKYLLSLNARDDVLSYNRHNGDMKFHTVGYKLSEEHKRKISPKGRIRSEASKAKLRAKRIGDKNPFYGKTHTPEYLQQVSQRMLTDNPSKRKDVKLKLAQMSKNRSIEHTRTPEALAKKSASVKRAWAEGLYDDRKKMFGDDNPSKRPEVRQAISKALTGKQGGRMIGRLHSPETKAKMAEARRLYWANRKD